LKVLASGCCAILEEEVFLQQEPDFTVFYSEHDCDKKDINGFKEDIPPEKGLL